MTTTVSAGVADRPPTAAQTRASAGATGRRRREAADHLPADLASRLADILTKATARLPYRHVAFTVLCDGWLRTTAASDHIAADLDAAQYEFGGGPGGEGFGADPACCHDLVQETRWPGFSRFGVERGVRSVLICRWAQHPRLEVALSVYSHEVAAFDKSSAWLAQNLVAAAGPVIVGDLDG